MADHDMHDASPDLSSPQVLQSYRAAAEIANNALAHVLKNVAPGASVVALCELGDKFINEATQSNNNKDKTPKGVAFPTCVSLNQTACHFSPVPEEDAKLKEGDAVKIDLGVHVDGYIATVAHTVVLTKDPVSGAQANVMAAAVEAAQAVLDHLKPGKTNAEITNAIAAVAQKYNVSPFEGSLSHQLDKFVLDGDKVIIGKATPEHKVENVVIGANEVYAIDILMTSGDGKLRDIGTRTTVFKRVPDTHSNLRLDTSRKALTEINRRFATMPFTVRALSDKKLRFGVGDCVKHDLLQPFPVLSGKAGEALAHLKFTALVLPEGTTRITGANFPVQPLNAVVTAGAAVASASGDAMQL